MNKSWLIPTLLFPVTLAIVPAATAQTLPDGPLTVASLASGDGYDCRGYLAFKSAEIVGGRLQLRAENHGEPVAWDLALKGGRFSAWKRLQMIVTLFPTPLDGSARITGRVTDTGLEGRVEGGVSGRAIEQCLVKFTMAPAGSEQAKAINAGEKPLEPKRDFANQPGAAVTGAPAREQESQVAAVEPTATPVPAGKIKSDTMTIEKPPGADIPDGEVSPFRIGQTYEAFAPIFDGSDYMQIPLPAGAWQVFGVKESQSRTGVSTFATVYLLQIVGKRPVSVLIVGYPVINRSSGWNVPSWCTRGRKHHFEGKAMYAGTQIDCWGVAHAEMTKAKEDSPASQLVRYAQSLGIRVPANTVYAQYTRADYGRYFRVAYYVNPEMAGLGPPEHADYSSSDYHPDRIGNYPKKKAFVEHVTAWSKAWKKAIDLGFAGKLTAARMAEFAELHPLPGPVVAPPSPRKVERTAGPTVINNAKPAGAASVEDRLRRIKRLLDEDLITADEAAALRRDALKDL